MHIKLDDLVSDNFKKIFAWIVNCTHYMFVLRGGRYSGKSVVVGEAIVLGVMSSKKSACCLMQYKSDLGSKIVDNFTFCINNLKVNKYWKLKKSPYEYVLLDNDGNETDVSIRFSGCDDIQQTKGLKSRTGEGFKYIWLEEANRFKNWDIVQAIIDTCDRLNEPSCVILTYNPPRDASSWVNEKFDAPVGKALGYKTDIGIRLFKFKKNGVIKDKNTVICHSTMEDLIRTGHSDWVSDGIYGSAMEAKESNPKFYNWNYLGAVVAGDAQIFWNVTRWEYDPDISDKVRSVLFKYGFDVSNGGKDPYAIVKCLWVPDKRDLYILNSKQIVGNIGSANSDNDVVMKDIYMNVADAIVEMCNTRYDCIFGDGIIKNTIQYIIEAVGSRRLVYSAKEGYQYSKQRSVTFLQGLNHIYIDPAHDPIAWDQFSKYSYKLDKEDNVTCILPDGNDHLIDATIYSLVDTIAYDGYDNR